jgi:hypothetical protein
VLLFFDAGLIAIGNVSGLLLFNGWYIIDNNYIIYICIYIHV